MGVVSFLVLKPCRASSGMTCGTTTVETSDDASSRCWHPTDLVRAAYHPDFHRRSWSFTRSTGRWLRPGRGLSPPVRNYTDPGARVDVAAGILTRARLARRCDLPHVPWPSTPERDRTIRAQNSGADGQTR